MILLVSDYEMLLRGTPAKQMQRAECAIVFYVQLYEEMLINVG